MPAPDSVTPIEEARPQARADPVRWPGLTWSRTFPGDPEQAGQARSFLAGILGDCPAAADAALCLSELVANAIEHSRSGAPGGEFTVRVTWQSGRLRVEVHDQGGPWTSQPARKGGTDGKGAGMADGGSESERGRGLAIVAGLAGGYGVDPCPDLAGPLALTGAAGRRVWFELDCV